MKRAKAAHRAEKARSALADGAPAGGQGPTGFQASGSTGSGGLVQHCGGACLPTAVL